MDSDFSSLRIDGGMFSPEFLRRIADASPELDGCAPADYSTAEEGVNNLRDHLNYLWNRSIAVWDRFGPSGEEDIPASRVRGFLRKLMRDLGLDLSDGISKHQSTGDRPQLDYDLGGSLWHVVPSEVHLDQRSETIGTRRTSPHNLVQGELTSSEHHGWGLLTNGRQVRILRKTNRPSIQEALEFDIETMFNDRLYADFCLFAMMVHGTRWSRNKDAPMSCWLETWYKSSKEEGLSVLEDLRGCVQQAANALGTGLVRFQAGNQHLRDRLRSEAGLADELQREIMRYMYKLIFLFVMEDRNLLLRGNGEDLTPELETARERYMLGYSTQRHRSVVATTKGDEHHNFFEEVKLVISFLYKGEERLALPALGSYLFSGQSTGIIDGCTLLNTDFMKTLYHLCTFKKKDGPRQRVHWKTLRETELGSVYESLLELRPSIDLENGTFTLVSEAGNDRKSSGSYYTPADLVDHLITTTIDPLLDDAKKQARKEAESPEDYPRLAQEAILKLTVCDPACGSGHFLVAALERIAMELARIETGEHHPGISFIRKWKRLASSRCIYGVDLNPLAVELCKVAIWMDTYDGTNPLSFLDGHIRHGNSLLGQRLEKMGLIPDDAIPKAWVDQRKEHRKFNREQLVGKMNQLNQAIKEKEALKLLSSEIVDSTIDLKSVIKDIASQQAEVTLMSESNLEQIEHKATQLQRLNTDERSNWAKEVLDASMAMWWWPEPDLDEHNQMMADPPVPLASFELNRYATWLANQYGIEDDTRSNSATPKHNFSNDETRFHLIRAHTERIANEQSFFHWELEFAEAFFGNEWVKMMGGFSAMVGNPPWEVLSNEERAWFAGRHEDIANCTRTSTRRAMIEDLGKSEDEADRKLFKAWKDESENTIRTRTFMSKSGAYPLTAKGTLNLAPMFAEAVVNFSRNSGIIVPSTVLTDISTRAHFVDLVSKGRLHEVLDLVNQKPFFTQAGQNLRFVLLSVRQESKTKSFQCLGNQLRLPSTTNINSYTVTKEDLRVLYGDDPSCPMFPSMQAFQLAKQLAVAWTRYNGQGGWEAQYGRMVDMAVDSHHFVTYEDLNENANLTTEDGFLWKTTSGENAYVPLYEAKLFDAHQPRFGDFSGVAADDRFGRAARSKRPSDEDLSDPNYAPLPRYWVPVGIRDAWFKQRGVLDHQHGQVATRGICRGLTDSRSLKAAVLPNEVALGHSAGYWLAPEQDPEYPFVLATVLNSLLADYQARMYLTGINLSKYLVEMIYMPTPDSLRREIAVIDGVETSVWHHLLSLSFQLHHEWNYLQHPLSNNSPRRAVKNPLAVIDALLAKQAGLSRPVFEWMIGRFNIWERQIGTEVLLVDRLQWFDAIQILKENLP